MKIYGGVGSPFARRVRFLLHELNLPFEAVDTLTEAGQVEMRRINPVWKVPCVEIDGEILWDSQIIIDYLTEKYRGHPKLLRVPEDSELWRERKILNAVNAGVEASVNLGYMLIDGVETDGLPYLVKQRTRIHSILSWLKKELRQNYFTEQHSIGMAELALYCFIDYLRARKIYPVHEDSLLQEYLDFHVTHPGFIATKLPN